MTYTYKPLPPNPQVKTVFYLQIGEERGPQDQALIEYPDDSNLPEIGATIELLAYEKGTDRTKVYAIQTGPPPPERGHDIHRVHYFKTP